MTLNEAGTKGGPFRHLRSVAIVAAGYALACGIWVGFGTDLPGGRWFAVHRDGVVWR